MAKFELNTSFQFPFFRLNELVSYVEVKKPSGIAYMLLVLIKESKNRAANLSLMLENFGIPKNLHFMYENTITDLESKSIIEVRNEKEYFSEYTIGDFSFTPEGEKIFSNESIPTGITKEVKIPVWYNIALNSLSVGLLDSSTEPKPLMDSPITHEFMDRFPISKDIEAFLKLNQGKKIPIYDNNSKHQDDIIIKKEEVITKVETQEKIDWVAKYDCSMRIDNDNLTFDFDNKQLNDFFSKNYSSEMINSFIKFKKKFSFKSSHSSKLKLSSFSSYDIAQILIPKEIEDELKKKNRLLITKGNYKNDGCFSIDNKEGLNIVSNSCEFVIVGQDNSIYAYVPGIFKFNNNVFGDIFIPLVLKLRISLIELQKIVTPYLNSKTKYSEESFKEIVKLANITKETKTVYDILSGYMVDNPQTNIAVLKEIKDSAMSNETILQEYRSLLASNYHDYAKTINMENIESFLKITHSIPKFIGLSEADVLKEIFSIIGNVENKLTLYEILSEAGFDKKIIVAYANPIPEILNGGTSKDETILDFINYRNCIEQMKELTGIKDAANYVIDLESIDKTKYKKCYETASSLATKVNLFMESNTDTFKSFDSLMNVFKRINDDINMLEIALKSPGTITKETIEKKITNGDFAFVFVNLAAKLESILRNKFKLSGTLHDMLKEGKAKQSINANTVSSLFDFKEIRNAYIHAGNKSKDFEPDDLRIWSDEIFSLESEVS